MVKTVWVALREGHKINEDYESFLGVGATSAAAKRVCETTDYWADEGGEWEDDATETESTTIRASQGRGNRPYAHIQYFYFVVAEVPVAEDV